MIFIVRFIAKLKRKAEARGTSERHHYQPARARWNVNGGVGVQILVGSRPQTTRDAVLLRGDIVNAISWVNERVSAKDRRAGQLLRLVSRMESQAVGPYHENTFRELTIF